MLDLQERPAIKAAEAEAAVYHPIQDSPVSPVTQEEAARINALLLRPKPAAPAADPTIDHAVGQTAVWAPKSSSRIRTVETLMILSVMGYCAVGLVRALGLV